MGGDEYYTFFMNIICDMCDTSIQLKNNIQRFIKFQLKFKCFFELMKKFSQAIIKKKKKMKMKMREKKVAVTIGNKHIDKKAGKMSEKEGKAIIKKFVRISKKDWQ